MKTKSKLICVEPKTDDAKDRFNSVMHNLHSCRVDSEDSVHFYLSSISGRYNFQMKKLADPNWEIVK